ncbi:Trna-Dihydrouridine(47) Synthase [Nad(P)(+)]-Like [Manis pentadactyla]|nr:Trna-Dihydrouridine(47) Synthase [Nad(P)(+)]-Like [Manis pentadactyla]
MWEFCPGDWCLGLVVRPRGRLCRDGDREMPGSALRGRRAGNVCSCSGSRAAALVLGGCVSAAGRAVRREQRHWDISSAERLDILRDFTHYGLEHWGSDTQGVEKTRRFLLEWLSFLCRRVRGWSGRGAYVPVGLLERLPQRIRERPPCYLGRDYLETLMASQTATDWIRISEMLLGPVPPNFIFLPKHKANAYK